MSKSQFTRITTMALSPDVFERVKNISEKLKMSMASWIRQAIDEKLERTTQEITKIHRMNNAE